MFLPKTYAIKTEQQQQKHFHAFALSLTLKSTIIYNIGNQQRDPELLPLHTQQLSISNTPVTEGAHQSLFSLLAVHMSQKEKEDLA